MTWEQWRQQHVVPRVPDRQVIDSLPRFVYALSVGPGSRHHFVHVARFLVHDDRTKRGWWRRRRRRRKFLCRRRPLNRRRPARGGDQVRGTRTVIRAHTATSADRGRKCLCPVIALESCALRRRKAVGATWAKGYGHEGGGRE